MLILKRKYHNIKGVKCFILLILFGLFSFSILFAGGKPVKKIIIGDGDFIGANAEKFDGLSDEISSNKLIIKNLKDSIAKLSRELGSYTPPSSKNIKTSSNYRQKTVPLKGDLKLKKQAEYLSMQNANKDKQISRMYKKELKFKKAMKKLKKTNRIISKKNTELNKFINIVKNSNRQLQEKNMIASRDLQTYKLKNVEHEKKISKIKSSLQRYKDNARIKNKILSKLKPISNTPVTKKGKLLDSKQVVKMLKGSINTKNIIVDKSSEIKSVNKKLNITYKRPSDYEKTQDYDYMYDHAKLLYEQGKKDKALAILKNIVALNTNEVRAYENIVKLYLEKNDEPKASKYLEKALAIDANNILLNITKANILLLKSQNKSAIKLLQSLQYNPSIIKYPDYYSTLALVYSNLQQFDKSANIYHMLIKTYPKNAKYQFGLAYSLDQNGKHNAAKDYYNKSIKLGKLPLDLILYSKERIDNIT